MPLLATQILWINLLTDTGPALAMGFDPPPDDVMERPPRRLTDRVIDAEMQVGIVVVGLTMAVAALVGLDLYLPGGLIEGSSSLTEARTVAFTTLVLAQLWNCLNARSDHASFVHHLFTNPPAVGGHRRVAAAAGRRRARAAAQRRLRHDRPVAGPVGCVRGARRHRAGGGRGVQGRAAGPGPALTPPRGSCRPAEVTPPARRRLSRAARPPAASTAAA